MDRNTFETIDPIVDEIADVLNGLLKSAETEKLRSLLTRLNKAVGDRREVNLVITVDVFDPEKERCLPLLQTGMSGFGGDKPYQTWSDSTPGRYIVEGEMLVVPHDRCPKCWETWDFKFQTRSCPHCGAALGRDVKLLLDTDVCPHCEKGKVTVSRPTCTGCGYVVDLNDVVWG